jgi:hypothetical protein
VLTSDLSDTKLKNVSPLSYLSHARKSPIDSKTLATISHYCPSLNIVLWKSDSNPVLLQICVNSS